MKQSDTRLVHITVPCQTLKSSRFASDVFANLVAFIEEAVAPAKFIAFCSSAPPDRAGNMDYVVRVSVPPAPPRGPCRGGCMLGYRRPAIKVR